MAQALQNWAAVQRSFQDALAPINNFVAQQSQRRYAQQVMAQQQADAAKNREEAAKLDITNRLATLGISVPKDASLADVQEKLATVPDTLGVRAADEIISIDKQIDGTLKKLGDATLAAPYQSKKAAAVKFLSDPDVIQELVKNGKDAEDIAALRSKIATAGSDADAEKLVNTTINDLTSKWFWRTDKEKRGELIAKFTTLANGGVEGIQQSPQLVSAIGELQTLIQQRGQRYNNLNSAGFDRLREVKGSSVPPEVTAAAVQAGRLDPSAPEAKSLFGEVGLNATAPGNQISIPSVAGTVAPAVTQQLAANDVQARMNAVFGGAQDANTRMAQAQAALQGLTNPKPVTIDDRAIAMGVNQFGNVALPVEPLRDPAAENAKIQAAAAAQEQARQELLKQQFAAAALQSYYMSGPLGAQGNPGAPAPTFDQLNGLSPIGTPAVGLSAIPPGIFAQPAPAAVPTALPAVTDAAAAEMQRFYQNLPPEAFVRYGPSTTPVGVGYGVR